MFNWFRRENKTNSENLINSTEYEKLSKRLTDVESNVLSLVLDMDTFRNKVMRAYQRKKEQDEPQQQERKIGQPIKKV